MAITWKDDKGYQVGTIVQHGERGWTWVAAHDPSFYFSGNVQAFLFCNFINGGHILAGAVPEWPL